MDELIGARRAALHDVIDDAGCASRSPQKIRLDATPMSHFSQLIAKGFKAFRREQSVCDWPIRHLPLARRIAALVPPQPIGRAADIAIPELRSAEQKHPGEKYQ